MTMKRSRTVVAGAAVAAVLVLLPGACSSSNGGGTPATSAPATTVAGPALPGASAGGPSGSEATYAINDLIDKWQQQATADGVNEVIVSCVSEYVRQGATSTSLTTAEADALLRAGVNSCSGFAPGGVTPTVAGP